MMDHFGIGAAMASMVRIYQCSARRSGRTTSLIESVKEGDRIIFAERREADRVQQLLRDRGIMGVACLVVPPADPSRAFNSGTPQGRTRFDHVWLELFYIQVLQRAAEEIDYLERELSGRGEAHQETRRRAEEIVRWRG